MPTVDERVIRRDAKGGGMSCGMTRRLSTWLGSRLKSYGENADDEMMEDDDDSFWETDDEE